MSGPQNRRARPMGARSVDAAGAGRSRTSDWSWRRQSRQPGGAASPAAEVPEPQKATPPFAGFVAASVGSSARPLASPWSGGSFPRGSRGWPQHLVRDVPLNFVSCLTRALVADASTCAFILRSFARPLARNVKFFCGTAEGHN
jgi:hypothetical protein